MVRGSPYRTPAEVEPEPLPAQRPRWTGWKGVQVAALGTMAVAGLAGLLTTAPWSPIFPAEPGLGYVVVVWVLVATGTMVASWYVACYALVRRIRNGEEVSWL